MTMQWSRPGDREHPEVVVLQGLGGAVGWAAMTARVLARSGVLAPVRPDRLVRMGLALRRWGISPAAAVAAAAARCPDAAAIVDDAGTITYAELDRRSSAV